jgi:hypothetical protein
MKFFIEEKLLGLDEDYLPFFEKENKSGRADIGSSKNLKRILGYYTAVLEFGLQYGSLHPKLLLLDTPRQEELDFPIFTNIIEYWESLHKYDNPYQIIVTGSEFPINTAVIDEFYNPETSGDHSKAAKFSVN